MLFIRLVVKKIIIKFKPCLNEYPFEIVVLQKDYPDPQ